MIKAYIYYPNLTISIHNNPNCSKIRQHQKKQQRYIKIDKSSIATELQNFINKLYTFGSTAKNNDMWLEIDFDDLVFERNLLDYVIRLISKHYTTFANIQILTHRGCKP